MIGLAQAGWLHRQWAAPVRLRKPAIVALLAFGLVTPHALAQTDPFIGVSPPGAPATPRPPRVEPRPPPPPRQAAPTAPLPDERIDGRIHRDRLRLRSATVPLPPGDWVEINTANWTAQGPTVFTGGGRGGQGGGAQMQSSSEITLVRQRQGRIVAILVAQATTPDASAAAQWFPHEVCGAGESLERRAASADSSTQDCARLLRIASGQGVGSSSARGAIGALEGRRVGFVPATMLGVQYRFANSLRAMTVEYRFAPAGPDAALQAQLRSWMQSQHEAVRSGFNGRNAGPLAEP